MQKNLYLIHLRNHLLQDHQVHLAQVGPTHLRRLAHSFQQREADNQCQWLCLRIWSAANPLINRNTLKAID